ncbi:DUF3592 domain-containing protein [Spirosoma radiotolerans]|uniref:DUF3592 domain-containing protein n=1 Tax=Spirosoma radiotolerans TaxID=1379870 RepID=A0A0E3V4W1_9BACT|nr:DUF3592 domain-containing protein [Spirosoma radiotolerans]AKD53662.1 hypothetical protein SD10_00805 [Spirosoma radiotolerans]
MKFLIPLLIGGIFSSIFSILFLYSYYQLVRGANKITGTITSFDRSDFFILRQLWVPIVRFQTRDTSWIERQPDHSLYHELNYFSAHQEVTVYYKEDNPDKFVIESGLEVFINWMIIILTFGGIVWLFAQ